MPKKKFDPVAFARALAEELRRAHPDLRPGAEAWRLIEEFVAKREPTELWRERLVPLVWEALFPGVEKPSPRQLGLF